MISIIAEAPTVYVARHGSLRQMWSPHPLSNVLRCGCEATVALAEFVEVQGQGRFKGASKSV